MRDPVDYTGWGRLGPRPETLVRAPAALRTVPQVATLFEPLSPCRVVSHLIRRGWLSPSISITILAAAHTPGNATDMSFRSDGSRGGSGGSPEIRRMRLEAVAAQMRPTSPLPSSYEGEGANPIAWKPSAIGRPGAG